MLKIREISLLLDVKIVSSSNFSAAEYLFYCSAVVVFFDILRLSFVVVSLSQSPASSVSYPCLQYDNFFLTLCKKESGGIFRTYCPKRKIKLNNVSSLGQVSLKFWTSKRHHGTSYWFRWLLKKFDNKAKNCMRTTRNFKDGDVLKL